MKFWVGITDKNWFNYIVLAFIPDLDGDGNPDIDEETGLEEGTMGFMYSLSYTEKFTELENPINFYWWGQKREFDDNNHTSIRTLSQDECGLYLVRISLRQELRIGKRIISHSVYSSVDDPNFAVYDGIAHGYVPIYVNSTSQQLP